MYSIVKLTPKQEVQWTETRTYILTHQPGLAHIFYTLMQSSASQELAHFTADVPIAATNGKRLFLNPTTFFEYPLRKRVFIVLHEVMHCIWDHMRAMHYFMKLGHVPYEDGTKLPYIHQIMNVAQDYVINAFLIECKAGEYDPSWLLDTKLATHEDSAVDVYRKIMKNVKIIVPPGGGKPTDKPGNGPPGHGGFTPQGKGFDEHLPPGEGDSDDDPDEAAGKRNDAEWQQGVAEAMQSAKLQGKLPAAMERAFLQYIEPVVPWRDVIQSFIARTTGSDTTSYRRVNRQLIVRDIAAPGRTGFRSGEIAVAIDTSGSIGQRELDAFFTELQSMLDEVKPEAIHVIWCDAAVHKVDLVHDAYDIKTLKPIGGGGTDFRPPFDHIKNEGIEIETMIYMTDGYGTFPEQPPYPVVWASTTPLDQINYPFGETVYLPLKAA